MNVSDFDYELPPERIAQRPLAARDASRLLVLDRTSGETEHRRFSDLAELLVPGDLLVLNDTRVIPARLHGRKPSGGRVEVLLLEKLGVADWRCLLNASRKPAPGSPLEFAAGLRGRVRERDGDGWVVRFECDAGDPDAALLRAGTLPLPPYIRRTPGDAAGEDDRLDYQTVFARNDGAVAAPTAGLHFTEALLSRLERAGVETTYLTLHVGPGTFLPIRTDTVEDHAMHTERFVLPAAASQAVDRARAAGRRVIAVGTTAARTLEHQATEGRGVAEGSGSTGLFIYPGYRFRVLDALITNFHLPRSTLLMLASAFAGRERLLTAYREAIERGYRFYSYGDAMFLR